MYIGKRTYAAAHRDGNVDLVCSAADDVRQVVALVKTGDDIHKNDFVGPLRVIPQGKLMRVANNAQAFQTNALDEVCTFDIESGNDS